MMLAACLQQGRRQRLLPALFAISLLGACHDRPAGAGGAGRSGAVPAAARSGQEIYAAECMGCHASGIAGAPKVGDQAAWAARLAQGLPTLVSHVRAGYGAMPQRGNCFSCSDGEIEAAVEYLVARSR